MVSVKPKFFVSASGDLFNTELPNWSASPLRKQHTYTFRSIATASQLASTLRAGEFAWPGGYQMYLITSDGASICFDCARKEFASIAHSIKHRLNDGWRIVACDINYEDTDCQCDHCNRDIPAAYAD